MDRRAFATAAAGAAATALAGLAPAAAATGIEPSTDLGAGPGPQPGVEPFRIAMIIFDDMTNQDFVGPHDVFARVRAAQIDVLAKSAGPVITDARGRVLPDKTFQDARAQYDLLFIGGGPGTTRLMEDMEVIDFLRSRAPAAKYVTSVCTGALVLGAAGLLQGYRAATHWAAMEVLPLLGATPVHKRVVIDRDRITGGGVTAGIDFGLSVIAKLWGDVPAQTIQLGMEYNPQPPFTAGSPETAPPGVLRSAQAMLAPVTAARMAAARRVSSAGR